jgi:hypothetical protein
LDWRPEEASSRVKLPNWVRF